MFCLQSLQEHESCLNLENRPGEIRNRKIWMLWFMFHYSPRSCCDPPASVSIIILVCCAIFSDCCANNDGRPTNCRLGCGKYSFGVISHSLSGGDGCCWESTEGRWTSWRTSMIGAAGNNGADVETAAGADDLQCLMTNHLHFGWHSHLWPGVPIMRIYAQVFLSPL